MDFVIYGSDLNSAVHGNRCSSVGLPTDIKRDLSWALHVATAHLFFSKEMLYHVCVSYCRFPQWNQPNKLRIQTVENNRGAVIATCGVFISVCALEQPLPWTPVFKPLYILQNYYHVAEKNHNTVIILLASQSQGYKHMSLWCILWMGRIWTRLHRGEERTTGRGEERTKLLH